MHCADNGSQNFEPFVARLSAQDSQQGISLFVVGSRVDDAFNSAVPFMKRSRPGIDHGPVQAVQPDSAKVTLDNVHPRHSLASLVGIRQPYGVAWTRGDAVAVFHVFALHFPVDSCHLISFIKIYERPTRPDIILKNMTKSS